MMSQRYSRYRAPNPRTKQHFQALHPLCQTDHRIDGAPKRFARRRAKLRYSHSQQVQELCYSHSQQVEELGNAAISRVKLKQERVSKNKQGFEKASKHIDAIRSELQYHSSCKVIFHSIGNEDNCDVNTKYTLL